MDKPLTYLKQRLNEDWLIGYNSNQFNRIIAEFIDKFTYFSLDKRPPKILVVESDPWRFIAAFLAGVANNCPVFLGNPNWVESEWKQILNLVKPDLILADKFDKWEPNNQTQNTTLKTQYSKPTIAIPTGGSSGEIRFAIHTWDTLIASVKGFHQYFDYKPINSFCVLPLYHVSGLMQFLRCLITGGKFAIFPFKALMTGEGRNINPAEFFISLVPTQLQKLLNAGEAEWLSRFQTVLLGGAAPWESLLAEARNHRIRLAPTYGMTETASQIVTLKPEAFLAGNNSSGKILPHAKVTIRSNTGEILGINETGIITIAADSLALGYYPSFITIDREYSETMDVVGAKHCGDKSLITTDNINPAMLRPSDCGDKSLITTDNINPAMLRPSDCKKKSEILDYLTANKYNINSQSQIPNFQSDDLGFIDSEGYLTIIGRSSHKIITGGENVFPSEVEAAILATNLVKDVCVIGVADSYWGEAVTALYVPSLPETYPDLLREAIANKLCKFKHPKYWIPVEIIPRNSQGKINYAAIKQLLPNSLA